MAKGIDEAVKETTIIAWEKAIKYSSGTFKSRGEYARRDPHPPGDPAIINVGRSAEHLRDLWTVRRLASGKYILENHSPHADFMGGTKLMIERPILQRVRREVEPILAKKVGEGIERALGK